MKKLLSALVLSLVLIIGCQDNSTILAPDTDAETLNKLDNNSFEGLRFDPDSDSVITNGIGRPSIPRL